MRHMYNSWAVNIDITSACPQSCIYCTRYTRHLRKEQRVHLTLEQMERTLLTLKDWPAEINIIGGEPMLHPRFAEINALIRKHIPQSKVHIFTAGLPGMSLQPLDQPPDPDSCYDWDPSYPWDEWPEKSSDLTRTYRTIRFNPHTAEQEALCHHHPLTVAVGDVVEDEALMWKLINNCWTQRMWCATVNTHGAYFCEVAAALDHLLFGGRHAWEVAPGWWKRPPQMFQEQVEKLCVHCGFCVPMERQLQQDKKELFSPGLYKLAKEKGLARLDENNVTLFDRRLSKEQIIQNAQDWYPAYNREDLHRDGDVHVPAYFKGLPVPLELPVGAENVFSISTEEEFRSALAAVAALPFSMTRHGLRKLYFLWQGMIFDALEDQYPFALRGNENGNLLYWRGLMLYFRYCLDDAGFENVFRQGCSWERLARLSEEFDRLLEERKFQYYVDESAKFDGREVYFWGAGAAWRHFKDLFARAKPRAMLLDSEFLHRLDSPDIDGIPVRDPKAVLDAANQLPLIVFTRAKHVEQMEWYIQKSFGNCLQEEPAFFVL